LFPYSLLINISDSSSLEDPDGIQVGVGVTSIADFDGGMDNGGDEMITSSGGVTLKNTPS